VPRHHQGTKLTLKVNFLRYADDDRMEMFAGERLGLLFTVSV
jgi:hypothetical protein